jgi:hypothetical protein
MCGRNRRIEELEQRRTLPYAVAVRHRCVQRSDPAIICGIGLRASRLRDGNRMLALYFGT